MRSHTFEAAGNRDTRRLLVAISGSPSSKSGMTSDSFQRFGKTDDIRERFTISVIVGKMHCRAFLINSDLQIAVRGRLRVRVFRTEHALQV